MQMFLLFSLIHSAKSEVDCYTHCANYFDNLSEQGLTRQNYESNCRGPTHPEHPDRLDQFGFCDEVFSFQGTEMDCGFQCTVFVNLYDEKNVDCQQVCQGAPTNPTTTPSPPPHPHPHPHPHCICSPFTLWCCRVLGEEEDTGAPTSPPSPTSTPTVQPVKVSNAEEPVEESKSADSDYRDCKSHCVEYFNNLHNHGGTKKADYDRTCEWDEDSPYPFDFCCPEVIWQGTEMDCGMQCTVFVNLYDEKYVDCQQVCAKAPTKTTTTTTTFPSPTPTPTPTIPPVKVSNAEEPVEESKSEVSKPGKHDVCEGHKCCDEKNAKWIGGKEYCDELPECVGCWEFHILPYPEGTNFACCIIGQTEALLI